MAVKKTAREILRDVSARQGWTPETEISVLSDFIDMLSERHHEARLGRTQSLCQWLADYLKERSA